MSFELVQKLEIALFGIAVFACGLGGTQARALTFHEHGEFADDLVVMRHGKGTCQTDESGGGAGELKHEKE